ncbi:intracellular short-chain-length polyhydroxyalkanoate depolymerase [Neobacillus sp. LXY-4]|uniref:intracellular short-chain-length polyhydroxyalkanoate depolymerase n=1 Tax=Neobacillus sp. LXY-4 TaxID=3379826 RepID=UPI003EDF4B68
MTKISLKKVPLPNGETIAYREREGGVKKVLLIHGNMTSSKHWDLILENMDSDYKLIALDLRGFGESSYRQPIWSLKDFADDVKLFVDAIKLTDFSLVGWSTGGGVGMQFVADYPGYTKKLVLLDSVSTRGYPIYAANDLGLPDPNKRLTTYEQIKADPLRAIPIQAAYIQENRELLKAIWNGVIYDRNQPEPERYEEYVDDMLTQRNYAEVNYSLNTFNISAIHNEAATGTNQAKEITIPVLVLRGEHDLVITKEMAQEILVDLGQNARFVELKNCGHSPLVDDLVQLLSVISEFLNE